MRDVIKDVQNMFVDGNMPEVTDEWCNEFGKRVASMLKGRLQERTESSALRLSALGRGNRYLWYSTRLETPKEKLTPDTRIKFLYGDLIEELFIALIKLSGHEVTKEQEEVELNGIKGHIDCLVDGKLVDIKSASSFSYKKFKANEVHLDDPFGYYAQLAAYKAATGYPVEGWLVMDKTLGHICASKAHENKMPDMDARSKNVKGMVEQEIEPMPCHYPVPDGKSGNEKLPTQCSYCPYKQHCWRGSNDGKGLRGFLYSNGVRWLTHVEVEPKVQEIEYGS